jgi:hypothetical protein
MVGKDFKESGILVGVKFLCGIVLLQKEKARINEDVKFNICK